MTNRRITSSLCILSILLLVLLPGKALPGELAQVLVLHSYHKGFRWTDFVQQGIESTFEKMAPPGTEILVEYMDTKRNPPAVVGDTLRQLYAIKYAKSSPSVIITSDDNAFNFIRDNAKSLFPGVPVVFCGVNNFKDADLTGLPQFTGILEDFSVSETLETIQTIQPQTKRVYVVSDQTPTGIINLKRFTEVAPAFAERFEFVLLADGNVTRLRQTLASPPPGSVILDLSFYRDSDGKPYSPQDSVDLINKSSNLPIYTCWDFVMNTGALGGKVVSGINQGKQAARMALSILDGTTPQNIPLVRKSPNQYMFDYKALQRFGISSWNLPQGSSITNQPSTFYYRHRQLVWFVVAVIVTMGLLILFLAMSISRRTQVECKLREAEEQYRTIFDNIPDGFYRTDLQGNFLLVNPEAARMLGLDSPEQARKFNIAKHVYQSSENRKDFMAALLQQGRVSGFSTTCKRLDGTFFDVEVNSVLIRDRETGNPVAVEGLVRDITERNRMQEFMVQNEKMVSLGGLAAGMAHEINNPLAGILQMLQNLERRLVNPLPANEAMAKQVGITMQALNDYLRGRNILKNIAGARECAERAAGIVANMLDFSRRNEQIPVPCDANELVASAVRLARTDYDLKKGYDFKKLSIEQELFPKPLAVGCLRTEIEQVLFNLLQNAAHALVKGTSDGKSPRITLRTRCEDKYAIIEISDNGHGIPEADLKLVFEPFFTTKPPGVGTGLGLSVSYFIITQKHNGFIEVLSPAGNGATFIIHLPLTEEPSCNA